MKRKELRIFNFFLILLVIGFGLLTVNTSINQDLFSLAKTALADKTAPATPKITTIGACSKSKPLKLASTDPELTRLAQYQDVCGSQAANKLMIFTAFPETRAKAEVEAATMAQKLKNFQRSGVSPIVIVEPYVGDQLMPYKDYLRGVYDSAVEAYFTKLKAAGVTDQMMGMWVPFPESNTPSWDNKDTEPRDFSLAVNRYLGAMKKRFPTAKGSILLSATTYEPTDTEYANGNYIDLTPYVQEIDKTLVSSFGVQGFPWVSDATKKRHEIFRASEFLQPDLVIAAAQELRTRDIWLNTGSFGTKYTRDKTKTVQISINERKAILSGILEEAHKIQTSQQNEYRVSINLFAEDKSNTNEATDWSYFQNNDTKLILREFLGKAEETSIPVSLFDRTR